MNNTDNIVRTLFIEIEGKTFGLPEGPIEKQIERGLIGELMDRWPNIAGGSDSRMAAHKLPRAENLRIENGVILFEIERHAGTINGSTRADVHTWEVNLQSGCAGIIKETHRQLKPMAKAYTKADARKSAHAVLRILTGRRKNRGELEADNSGGFIVNASSFVDLGNYNRTIIGRRKQFIKALKEVLPTRGWCVAHGDQYTPEIYLQRT